MRVKGENLFRFVVGENKKQPSKLIARVCLHREITSQIGKRLSQRGRN